MERFAHEEQQLRGNQQMMNSVDYSGLNNGPDSYRFDLPNNGGLVSGATTTIVPTTSSDPLTFMQPSVVRDEILSGTVPTIIHRSPALRLSDQQLDMHEMQTLIGSNADSSDLVNEGEGGAVQVVPNMTMSTAMSEDTLSVPSGGGSSLLLEGEDGGSDETLNGSNGQRGVAGIGVPLITSTPTKGEQQKLQNGRGLAGGGAGKIEELPIVELYQPMMSFTNNNNNNNPKLVNRNNVGAMNGNGNGNGNGIPKVQVQVAAGRKNGPVYSTVNKKAVHGSGSGVSNSNRNGREEKEEVEVEAQPWEKDNLINKRDERLVHENGYAEDDDSRMGLLLNGSAVSNGSDSGGSSNNTNNKNKNTKGGLVSNPLWETFRRPIVGPNG